MASMAARTSLTTKVSSSREVIAASALSSSGVASRSSSHRAATRARTLT